MSSIATSTAPSDSTHLLDAIVRLRALETGDVYDLPLCASSDVVLGSQPTCTILLRDPTRQLSRRHARLVWRAGSWVICDLASKNGTWIDGARRSAAALHPGAEVRLGGLTLLAESPGLIRLRSLLARYVGFADRDRPAVDGALRALRDVQTGGMSLVLCGDGDLPAIAARLHRELVGSRYPFVNGHDAATAALLPSFSCATVCLDAPQLPRALDDLLEDARHGAFGARIVLCTPTLDHAAAILSKLSPLALLVVPPMTSRCDDLMRMFAECVDDAARELGQPQVAITEHDLLRVRSLPFASFSDLEDTARRLVAIRTLGVVSGAARLGLSHGALSRWAKRRRLSSSPTR